MKTNNIYFAVIPLCAAIQVAWAQSDISTNQELDTELSPIVVIASKATHPTIETINPKNAIQPLPAQDGADLLKSISGMNVIRKGGSSGDPLLRGLGGSRLLILADDQFILGGCPGRMDPPTSYIFPASYDRIVVTKGPQSVSHGPGMIAGSVRFIRDENQLKESITKIDTSITKGSFGRTDAYIDGTIGNELGWLRLNASHNESKDYKDGNREIVHSGFERDNQMLQAALTPTENTLMSIQYERSRGEAKYADRSLDGSKFDRDAWSLNLRQQNINDWLTEIKLEYGQSEVDHVMDNYSLRDTPWLDMGGGMGHGGSMGGNNSSHMGHKPSKKKMYSVMNPGRNIKSGKLSTIIDMGNIHSRLGTDWQKDEISSRPMVMSMDKNEALAYDQLPFSLSQTYNRHGIFVETDWQIDENNGLFVGYRRDWTKTSFSPKKYEYDSQYMNQKEGLNAGFIRYEHKLKNLTTFVGYGISERAPDYWERSKENGEKLNKETNHQIDAGILYQTDVINSSFNVFASRINDFILIQQISGTDNARHINAQRYGFEAAANWNFSPNWTIGTSLAYTRGKNLSDGIALAQTPPLEWRTHLNWENERLSLGALWRVVGNQNRFAKGQGNIIGTDMGSNGGFGTLALNAGWKINKNTIIQLGIDNLFNKTYSESVNKAAYSFDTFSVQDKRINEPGRTIWAKAQLKF